MFERFTRPARTAVVDAKARARELGHRNVGTEHLLLALTETDGGAGPILRDAGMTPAGVRAAIARLVGTPGVISDEDAAAVGRIGIDIHAVRAKIEESFGPGAFDLEPPRAGRFGRRAGGPFSPRSKKVLELALREAIRLRHTTIGTEHLLLGLIREGQGLAARILADAGVDPAALRRDIEASLRAAA
ncbi:MAG TPA: Clp protease N-terminal domain-containing protein [Micromonosporaceae bacterium]|jgi:ATP-dependent Clp protease ATP-binding subunit ClpA